MLRAFLALPLLALVHGGPLAYDPFVLTQWTASSLEKVCDQVFFKPNSTIATNAHICDPDGVLSAADKTAVNSGITTLTNDLAKSNGTKKCGPPIVYAFFMKDSTTNQDFYSLSGDLNAYYRAKGAKSAGCRNQILAMVDQFNSNSSDPSVSFAMSYVGSDVGLLDCYPDILKLKIQADILVSSPATAVENFFQQVDKEYKTPGNCLDAFPKWAIGVIVGVGVLILLFFICCVACCCCGLTCAGIGCAKCCCGD